MICNYHTEYKYKVYQYKLLFVLRDSVHKFNNSYVTVTVFYFKLNDHYPTKLITAEFNNNVTEYCTIPQYR